MFKVFRRYILFALSRFYPISRYCHTQFYQLVFRWYGICRPWSERWWIKVLLTWQTWRICTNLYLFHSSSLALPLSLSISPVSSHLSLTPRSTTLLHDAKRNATRNTLHYLRKCKSSAWRAQNENEKQTEINPNTRGEQKKVFWKNKEF